MSGKDAVNIVAKKAELSFDSENVSRAIALAIVPIHVHVTSAHVLNGVSGASGVLVLSLVKLAPDFVSANVKMLPIILTVAVKTTSLTINHVTKDHVRPPRRLLRQRPLPHRSRQRDHHRYLSKGAKVQLHLKINRNSNLSVMLSRHVPAWHALSVVQIQMTSYQVQ